MTRKILFLTAVTIILIPVLTGSATPAPLNTYSVDAKLDGLEDFIERGMSDWGIPGMGVSIVKDDEIVYAEGFGVKKLGENDPVDEHTLFGIASVTKGMVSTAMGILVEEGKLGWNDRVRDHLEWFELSDQWVSDNVTIRDLLSHQVGIGRMTGNRIIFMPHRDPRTIMEHIKHQPFEATFRSRSVYSNVMYMVAGMIIEEASGMSWDLFLEERVLRPTGMTRSNASFTKLQGSSNVAWPHQEIEGRVQTIPRRSFDNVGPAGAVNASAYEAAKWMKLNLGDAGEYKGERIIDERIINQVLQPQQARSLRDPYRDQLTSYALGWGLNHYEGYRTVQHSGAIDGMNTTLVLVPELELGIFITANLFNNFRSAFVNHVMDIFMGIEREIDWHEYYYERHLKSKEAALERRNEVDNSRVPDTRPSLPLEEYTGSYFDKVYDDLEVKIGSDGNLELHFWGDGESIADLEHWHFDTFRATWRNPAMREKFVTFDLDQYGKVKRLNVNFTLRPSVLQAGIYPANYFRIVSYEKGGR